MLKMIKLTFTLITVILLALGTQSVAEYSYAFNIYQYEPFFELGYMAAGYTLRVNLTTTKTNGITFDTTDTVFVVEKKDETTLAVTCTDNCATQLNCVV